MSETRGTEMGFATSGGGSGLPGDSRGLRWISLVVSAVSLAGVVLWASQQRAPKLPSTPAELGALAAAVVAYAAATAVRSERWRWLLRASHPQCRPSRADSYGLMCVGYMGNNVLPARGGDLMRIYFMGPRAHTGRRTVIGSLVGERVLDVLVLLGMFALVAYGVRGGAGVPGGGRMPFIVGAILLLLGALAATLILVRRGGRAQRIRDFLRPMLSTTRVLWGRFGVKMLGVTIVMWLVEAGTWWGAAGAAGLHIDAVEVLYLLSLASVFILVPAGPGNLGTLDAAIIFGVHSLGGTGSEALGYLLILRFVLFVPITLVGLGVLIVRYGGFRREALVAPEVSSA